MLLGPVAFAAKKGQSFVVVTLANGNQLVSKSQYKAREAFQLAAKFNSAPA